MKPIDSPSSEDYAMAEELRRAAEEAGVGTVLLCAMVIRRLGCEMSNLRRIDPRTRPAPIIPDA